MNWLTRNSRTFIDYTVNRTSDKTRRKHSERKNKMCASRVLKLDWKTSLKISEIEKMSKFKRPEKLSFPQIYYTFKAKDKNSENLIEYRVQDMPEEYFEQALEFMVKYFLPDETFCSSRDIPNKPSAVAEICEFWRDALKHRLSIACFRNDGSDELVAANVLMVSSKDDPVTDTKIVSGMS